MGMYYVCYKQINTTSLLATITYTVNILDFGF
jgi:hypothetical protein